MRICYLADAQSPHTQKWVTHFANKGYEIHLISFRTVKTESVTLHYVKPPFIKEINNQLHAGRNVAEKLAYVFCINEIKKLIKAIDSDILHAFLATSYGFYFLLC